MQTLQTIFAALVAWIVNLIASTGYVGVLGLMAVESACVPLPSEIIMPFAGYLVSLGHLDLWLVATAGALGCNLGSLPPYEVARRGGRALVLRFGKWLLLTEADADRAQHFFNRFGGAAVLFARLLPGVRSFIAIPAGLVSMRRVRFHIYTFLGSWPWCFALAYVGMALGKRWQTDERLSVLLHNTELIITVITLAALARFVWVRLPK